MQPLLIDLGWKSALIAAAALVACRALRGRAAGERVLALRLGIGALLALPLLAIAGPSLELAVLPAEDPLSAAAPMAAAAGASETLAPVSASLDPVLAIYGLGVAAVLLRLGLGLFTLWRWTRTAAPSVDPLWAEALDRAVGRTGRRARLRVSAQVDAPLSWGMLPAWILIGPDTEKQRGQAEAVLAHEMAHVARLDWPMLVIAQLATALLWFNPLVWWIGRTLAGESEVAADEEAIVRVAPIDYAQTLLAVGAGQAHRSACGMTYARSSLSQRIRGVLEAGPKRPASRLVGVAMLGAAAAIAGPLGAVRLVSADAQPIAAPAAGESLLPAVIPQAQAREMAQAFDTMPRAHPRKRRKAGPLVPVAAAQPLAKAEALTQAQAPAAAAPSDPSRFMPPVGKHAAGGNGQRAPWAGLPAEVQAKIVAAGKAPRASVSRTGARSATPGAWRLTQAASGMRAKAQAMERVAADPAVPADVREAYARTAGALHREARQMDSDAKRMLAPR